MTTLSVGDRFGRLTVTDLLPNHLARARCRCGVAAVVRRGNLASGHTQSCGCQRVESAVRRGKDSKKHGAMVGGGGPLKSEYAAWRNAKYRCTNPSAPQWAAYGGRGISVADEWSSDFAAFLRHIGPKPSPGLTLDRIDNDGDYAPGNVRWASRLDQARNRRAPDNRKRYGRLPV